MKQNQLEGWRKKVNQDAVFVTRDFLDNLCEGRVSKKVGGQFADATELAVAFIVQHKSQNRYLVAELIEDLTDIDHVAKETDLEQILASVSKSRDDLLTFSRENFGDALDDLSNYMALIRRYGDIESGRLFPFFMTLLRKFAGDSIEYRLSQDLTGSAPRVEAQWELFIEIGVSLAKWIPVISTEAFPCNVVDTQIFSERLRRFNNRFPGKMPSVLLENWSLVAGKDELEVNADLNSYATRVWVTQTERYDATWPVPPPEWPFPNERGPREHLVVMTARRSRPSSLTVSTPANKRLCVSSSCTIQNAAIGYKTESAHLMVDTTKQQTPFDEFIAASKEAKHGFEKIAKDQAINCESGSFEELVVGKWTTAVTLHFTSAGNKFISYLSSGDVNEEMETVFAEAVVLAVSLITTSENTKSFKRQWVIQAIQLLGRIYEKTATRQKKQSIQFFSSILASRNTLIVHWDSRFPDYLDSIATMLRKWNKQHERK